MVIPYSGAFRAIRRAALAVAAVLVAAVGALAAQRPRDAKRASPVRYREAVEARARAIRALLPPSRVTTPESEPNDSTATADPVTLLDSVTGVIDPAGDRDWYALDVPDSTRVAFDIDAQALGSPLDAILAIYAPDSVTLLAFSDDADGLDSRIDITLGAAGRYFVVVAGFGGSGCAGCLYRLNLGVYQPPAPGPGDPTTLFASGLSWPLGITATAAGELIVLDGDSLRRIGPNGGAATTLARGISGAADVVADGYGDLLVSALDSAGAVIHRVSPAGGARTVFTRFPNTFGPPRGITIGPDGDVWVGFPGWAIVRLDPLGNRKDSIPMGYTIDDMAFSPAGILTFTDGYSSVLQLNGRTVTTVITTPSYVEGLAFDRDGYLYVANGYLGEVLLYSPTFQPVGSVFARSNMGGPMYLAFGRTTSGAMTARLFNAQYGYNLQPPWIGAVVEMNPAAMRAPGFRVGTDLLRIANTSLRNGLMGADYADTLRIAGTPSGTAAWTVAAGALPAGLTLGAATGVVSGVPEEAGVDSVTVRVDAGGRFGFASFVVTVVRPELTPGDIANHFLGAADLSAAQERFLDLQGNRNGRADVGDFRAWLRSQNQLPAAPPAGERTP